MIKIHLLCNFNYFNLCICIVLFQVRNVFNRWILWINRILKIIKYQPLEIIALSLGLQSKRSTHAVNLKDYLTTNVIFQKNLMELQCYENWDHKREKIHFLTHDNREEKAFHSSWSQASYNYVFSRILKIKEC